MVAMVAIEAPGATDIEAARHAGNQALTEGVIRYIAANRNWTRLHGVKVSLCRNPQAPIAETTRFLPLLRRRDLGDLGDLESLRRQRSVPSAVAAHARTRILQRGSR